jgi:Asp-tRNA(Asn)/Glu-tRNA(Gln) amidotransferase A subunit family amidase
LAGLAGALRRGDLPLLAYIDRLESHCARREPEVLSLLPEPDRFARLRRDARWLLAQHPSPERRPPLFGVPLGVKDIFHVEGFPTRAGSRLPEELLRGSEAASVGLLRRAGVLILGKTVTTEFAYFAPGPTRNPHDPARTPGGSSSGSAAAVGAGLCPLALGTQTIGSIGRPAAYCGVVGYKPSYDRVSRDGVIPLAPAVDHVGFFTTDAASAALVAGLLCRDWRPPAAPSPSRPALGVPSGPYLESAGREALNHFRDVCERLADAGFRLAAVPAMSDFAAIADRHRRLVAAEAALVHEPWFKRWGELYQPKTAELIVRGLKVSAAERQGDLAGRAELRRRLEELMDAHRLDLWISPAAPGAAPLGLASTGDPIMNLPWTHAGLPAVVVPSGYDADSRLPLGLQIVARFAADESLLGWAAEIERVLWP